MFIEKINFDHDSHVDDSDDGFLFNNLAMATSHVSSTQPYREALDKLGIVVPRSMFAQAELDGERNTGNRCAVHTFDGFKDVVPEELW